MFSKSEYASLIREQLCEYGFVQYPRAFGNPRQEYIFSFDELMVKTLLAIEKKESCFISHNGYPKFAVKKVPMKNGTIKSSRIPITISLENILWDFDDPEKPENSLGDARNCTIFADELELDWSVQYSGSKGFHFVIHLPPKIYKFIFRKDKDDPESSADSLKLMIQVFQEFFHHHCGLRTTDPKLVSDAKRIIRIPFTPHVNRLGDKNGRYCVPLTRDQIQNWNIQQIIEYSKNPRMEVVKSSGGQRKSLEELITFLGCKPNPIKSTFVPSDKMIKTVIDDGLVEEIIQMIIRRKKICVADQLRSRNPKHDSRLFLVLFCMKYYDVTDTFQMNDIFEKFATEFNYDDFYDYDTRITQIDSIVGTICGEMKYRMNPKPHSCDGLKRAGLCYKNTALCPYYDETK